MTPRQEKFAQEVASGKSQAEAYRVAYPKAMNWKPETLWSAASRLMANCMVSARVAEIQEELSNKALWTREQSVKVLAEIAAKGDKNADRVRAVAELNSMHGFNAPEKIEHSGSVTSITRRIADAGS